MDPRTINSTAILHHTTRATVDLAAILDLNIYASSSAPVVRATLAPFAIPEATESCTSTTHEGHSHSHSSPHLNDITTVSIPLPPLPPLAFEPQGPASPTRFEEVLRSLLWDGVFPASPGHPAPVEKPGVEPERDFDILRSKSFFRTTDGQNWIMQGVREQHDLTAVPARVDVEDLKPKLVLIGRGLGDAAGITKRFLDAIADS